MRWLPSSPCWVVRMADTAIDPAAVLGARTESLPDGLAGLLRDRARPRPTVATGELAFDVDSTELPSIASGLGAADWRFVRSIKEECLNRLAALGEPHLRRTLIAFVEHYHRERNHQGLENALIAGAPAVDAQVGRIRRRERLGGLLNYSCRAA